jgi:hypothetical protein
MGEECNDGEQLGSPLSLSAHPPSAASQSPRAKGQGGVKFSGAYLLTPSRHVGLREKPP